MPSVSRAQHNFMLAVAHDAHFAKKAGVPQSVGQEFTAADQQQDKYKPKHKKKKMGKHKC